MPHGRPLESQTAKIILGLPLWIPIPNIERNAAMAAIKNRQHNISVQLLSSVGTFRSSAALSGFAFYDII